MAEKIVSPGVFTNERDLSFLPSGVAQIGAAIVGPTPKGPAFVPKIIRNFEEFKAYFGDVDENYYVPYAVRSYLKSAGSVTVVRVVSEGGYLTSGVAIYSGSVLYGLMLPTRKIGASSGSDFSKTDLTYSDPGSASLLISGTNVSADRVAFALSASASDTLPKVIGTSVNGPKNAYAYLWFQNALVGNEDLSFISGGYGTNSSSINLSGATTYGKYSPASSPMITSQLIGAGQATTDLFQIYTLGDGDAMNTTVKVSIVNNSLAGTLPGTDYGTFTILVREFTDTDQRPVVLETYSNLTLDPDSPNFISRRIGDRYYEVAQTGEVTAFGDYDNISKYIRIQVTDAVRTKAASPVFNPYGHAPYKEPFSTATLRLPTASLVTSNPTINSAYNAKAYYGINTLNTDNLNYFKPLASGAYSGSNVTFNLDKCSISDDYGTKVDSNSTLAASQVISGAILRGQDVTNIAKFTVCFQGGFDGMDPATPLKTGANIVPTNTVGMNCNSNTTGGTLGYKKALNVLSNAETYDINMIAIPGVTVADHSFVTTKAIEVAEDRGDCFVLLDPVKQGETVGDAVGAIANSGINTSYAATYWPWVKITDPNRLKPIWVPPSVVLPRVIAQSDTAAFEWFAPAGLNRGGIQDAVDVESKLSFAQRDTLYEARINPLATFPAQGVCVWGQKTLQTKASALDRINVRRLMITLKKFIASSSRYLVFENNTNETRQRFINIVTPYLENVKARQGLYAFRVVMDETNNTPDVIDRNQLYGQIFLQPAKTAEFIVLDFNILPTGATFDNA
jgi:Phage tail sheath protein subtilisin-like domain/Phage tail sheath C-terminal domain